MYFNKFPLRWYPFNIKNEQNDYLITNILRSVSITTLEKDRRLSSDVYYIQDSDTIYSISTDAYGHPDRWWIIAIYNNMFIAKNIFPYSRKDFEKYINTRYFNIQPREVIKFYENEDQTPTTIKSLRLFYKLTPDIWSDLEVIQRFKLKGISIYEYEKRKNEKLKYIYLPQKQYIQEIEHTVDDKMQKLNKLYSK